MPKIKPGDPALADLSPQDRHRVERLKARLDAAAGVSPASVGKVLPEAVALGEAGPRRLSKSLVEVTERAIGASVRRDPETLSSALYPIIGSAVRRAVAKMLADGMAAMNGGLEKGLSFRRWAWRWQAWRAGVPFAEWVLLRTLRFRVDHVFLVHAETGLLLHSLSRPGAVAADSDLVASMLGAVRAYIKDSLVLAESEAVDGISAGDYRFVVEAGPKAFLAAVARGVPDGGLGTALQEALEAVHLALGAELEGFSGDDAPFAAREDLLKPCLLSRDLDERKRPPVYAALLLGVLFLGGLFLCARGELAAERREAFAAALSREPGMLVAGTERRWGGLEVRLLRDPRARSMEDLAKEYGADLARFDFDVEEFVSPRLSGGAELSGPLPAAALPAAPAAPAAQARLPGAALPAPLESAARELEGRLVLFELDSPVPRSGQEAQLEALRALLGRLGAEAKKAGLAAEVEVVGHAAGGVADAAALKLSRDRADRAYALLGQVGVRLTARGAGPQDAPAAVERSEADKERNRSVSFKATFR